MRGVNNPSWVGDAVGYSGVHDRVKRLRGLAINYPCVHCGGQAEHWSYDHEDVNEKISTERSSIGRAYSLDLVGHYDPRCVSCHRAFDIAHADAAASPSEQVAS